MSGPSAVVEQADVVCTLTPSVTPVLAGAWLVAGQHVNAVGARPDPTSAKLDAAAMARGTLVVDNRATAAAKSGDLLLAIEDGAPLRDQSLARNRGDCRGQGPGRMAKDEVTVFNSVGIGAQDLALAAAVLQLRASGRLGTTRRGHGPPPGARVVCVIEPSRP